MLDLRGDPGTEVTIAQTGRIIQQVKAPARISLAEGKYDLTVKGPVGVATTHPLAVSADTPSTIDVRNMAIDLFHHFPPPTSTASLDPYPPPGNGIC